MARDVTDTTFISSRDELVAWMEAGNKPPSAFRMGAEHEKIAFYTADHAPVPYEGRNGANSRNGTRSKTVLTEVGPVEIDVPRDRDGTFDPKLVRKRQRRLAGVDEMVISLTAKGLTTGEVQAHLAEVYGTDMSPRAGLQDHRRRSGGDGRVDDPPPRTGVPGRVHRRHGRQDP